MHQSNDEQSHAYEEHANNEAMARGRALERIRFAQRDRSRSNVGTSVHSSDSLASKEERSDSLDIKDILMQYPSHHGGGSTDNNFGGIGMDGSDDADDFQFPVILQREESEAALPLQPPEEPDYAEDEEDDDEALKEEESKDVREELFEAIPEPYWQSTEFQRVIITEASEASEEDTKEACRVLKKAMEIRERWISAHPFPPQDISDGFEEVTMSPHRKTVKDPATAGGLHPAEFRRRSVPPYKVFGTPLPETIPDMKFKMVNGVMHVNYVTVRDDLDDLDLPMHAISEEKTAGLMQNKSTSSTNLEVSDSDDEPRTPSPRTPARRPSFKRGLSQRIPSI